VFSPSASPPAGSARSIVDQPLSSFASTGALPFARSRSVPAFAPNTRTRTAPRAACSADSGTCTDALPPAIRATATSPSRWRNSHAGVSPASVLPNRTYFANPAEPAGRTSPPPRSICAASRLSISEYAGRSGPRAAGRSPAAPFGSAAAAPAEPAAPAALPELPAEPPAATAEPSAEPAEPPAVFGSAAGSF
jgi:hypothetical protein